MILTKTETPALLVVPIETRGLQGEAVLDTGCTFTWRQKSLWQNIVKVGEKLSTGDPLNFVLADGKCTGRKEKRNWLTPGMEVFGVWTPTSWQMIT